MQLVKNFVRSVLSELKLKNFGFQHNQVEQFYQSQWQSNDRSLLYLVYRWIWALFFVGVFTACLALQFSHGKLFIFLTNWGIMLCLATQLTAAFLVTRWHFGAAAKGDDRGRGRGGGIGANDEPPAMRTPFCVRFYWLLHGVSLSLALVITTIYWTFLHGKMNKPVRYPAMSFITHCLNSVFMLVDFVIVAFPVRILHNVYSMMLPIVYCLFTVVYFFCGGVDEYGNHYVYPILDWTNPVRGVITFFGVFALYLIFGLVIFALYKFRRLLHRTCRVIWAPQVVGMI